MPTALLEEHLLDDVLPDLVVQVEVRADDDAGDDHDDRPLNQLVLLRPLDLLELGPRLADEAEHAAAAPLAGLHLARRTRFRPRSPRTDADVTRHLAGLPMRCMSPAPAAVLGELHAVRSIPLRL